MKSYNPTWPYDIYFMDDRREHFNSKYNSLIRDLSTSTLAPAICRSIALLPSTDRGTTARLPLKYWWLSNIWTACYAMHDLYCGRTLYTYHHLYSISCATPPTHLYSTHFTLPPKNHTALFPTYHRLIPLSLTLFSPLLYTPFDRLFPLP